MNVQELIDSLLKIEDKTKIIHVENENNLKPKATQVYQAFGAVVIGISVYRD